MRFVGLLYKNVKSLGKRYQTYPLITDNPKFQKVVETYYVQGNFTQCHTLHPLLFFLGGKGYIQFLNALFFIMTCQ